MKTFPSISHLAAVFACLTFPASGPTAAHAEATATGGAAQVVVPPALANFVKASNERDMDAIAACFTSEAIVYDAGEIFRGVKEVRHWIAGGCRMGEYVISTTGVASTGETVVLTASFTGPFPEGPATVNFHCRMEGGKIAVLIVIQPAPALGNTKGAGSRKCQA